MELNTDKLCEFLNGLKIRRAYVPGGNTIPWKGSLPEGVKIAAHTPHVLSSESNIQRFIARINGPGAERKPVSSSETPSDSDLPLEGEIKTEAPEADVASEQTEVSPQEAQALEEAGKEVAYDIIRDSYHRVQKAPKRNKGSKQ